MNKTPPHYIDKSNNLGLPITHKWSEDATDDVYVRESPKLEGQLFNISFRGILMLSTVLAEWLLWRFDGLSSAEELKNSIDAIRAGSVDKRHASQWEWAEDKDYIGPVEGPIAHAAGLLSEIFDSYEIGEEGITMDTVYLIFLVRHVLPKKKPFEDWLKFSIEQLKKFHEREAVDKYGQIVSLDVFDNTVDYGSVDIDASVQRMLDSFDYQSNPYLNKLATV